MTLAHQNPELQLLIQKAREWLSNIQDDPKETERLAHLERVLAQLEQLTDPALVEFYVFETLCPELWALAQRQKT